MDDLLAGHGVDDDVRRAVQASAGRTFDSRGQLIAFLTERLGADGPQRYASQIAARGLKLADLYDITRGPVVGFAANGYLGQYLMIVPEQLVVAVRLIHQRESHHAPQDDYASFFADVLQLARALQ